MKRHLHRKKYEKKKKRETVLSMVTLFSVEPTISLLSRQISVILSFVYERVYTQRNGDAMSKLALTKKKLQKHTVFSR